MNEAAGALVAMAGVRVRVKGPRKRGHQKVIRTTVSITPALYDASQQLFKRHGFTGLSDYLQTCLRRDTQLELPSHAKADSEGHTQPRAENLR